MCINLSKYILNYTEVCVKREYFSWIQVGMNIFMAVDVAMSCHGMLIVNTITIWGSYTSYGLKE